MTTIPSQQSTTLGTTLLRRRRDLLAGWLATMSGSVRGSDRIKNADLDSQCSRFVEVLTHAAEISINFRSEAYHAMRQMLDEISRSRVLQGFTSTDTATFVFSFKRPLLTVISEELANDTVAMAQEIWNATELIDSVGLYATEVFCTFREDTIRRQQEEMLELSTPVVKLWDGILVVPLIGTLDSARTQVVMESLLESIVKANAQTAIIDITGVATVDTLVAQHLLKTVAAARLMGAECIISGVRPQIAQTIVHLGINLLDVTTKATLADAFALAIRRSGFKLNRPQEKSPGAR